MYISLHTHYAKGSIGDSILKTKEAIAKAKRLQMPALAITDHGSLANTIEFYKECNEQGIKPLIGLEAYEAIDRTEKTKEYYHTLLLAKNEQGYKDLLHIASDAQFNGYYYRPRTDMSVLKKYGSNLICLSACLGGRIPKMVIDIVKISNEGIEGLENNIEKIEKIIDLTGFELNSATTELKQLLIDQYINVQYNNILNLIAEYKECFADFYLELQPGDFDQQIIINKLLVDLAKETDTKLVITNDVHYLNKEDWLSHDQHVKMAKKKKHDDPMVYPDKCYYLMGYEEIRTLFPYLDQDIVEEAIANTVRIAEEINLDGLYDGKIKMPKADIPEGYSEDEYLAKISIDKLNEMAHTLKDPSEYYERAEYELETLREVGFSGYLLIIKDIYDYAYANNIPMGPGRGSIGGSLIAYLIGITKVDSIKYGLLFERFISRHRKGSIPDIDLDVAASYRSLLFDYVVNKYGKECCALVSTFTIRKARSAIKDTARIFNIDIDFADYVAKLIPQVYYNDEDGEKKTDLSIEEALEISEELRSIKAKHEDWFEAAMKLENLAKTTSIHAAGTLISPIPLNEYVPLIRNKDENGMMATALSLGDAEYAGSIKYDFLSLSTLDITSETEKDTGFVPNFDDDQWLSDPNVWDAIGSKNTTTLFQISSDTYKKRMDRLKPRTIEELAACLALVRGPCISSKLDEVYMQVIEGKREIELIHPFYDSVTASTNGVLLYQEQMMEILVNFGMSTERAFQIMKLAAKKKQDKLAKAEIEYRELADKNKVPEDITTRIWNIMLDTGKYSFNKSHAVSYALLSYYSAYLKTYYPLEWMKNALTNAYDRKESVKETIQECRRMGIRFLGLDINKSQWSFSIENNQLRVGFVAAKGLGKIAYDALNEARPYSSMQDVVDKVTSKFNKKAFVVSIFGGAFDEIISERIDAYNQYCEIRKNDPEEVIKISKDVVFNVNAPLQDIETVIYETPIMSNPVQYFEPLDLEACRNGQIIQLQAIVRRVKKIKDKKGNNMAFLTLETSAGYIDSTIFSDVYKGNTKYMKKNLVITLKAKKDKSGLIIEQFIA